MCERRQCTVESPINWQVSVDMWIIVKWKQPVNEGHGIFVGAIGASRCYNGPGAQKHP